MISRRSNGAVVPVLVVLSSWLLYVLLYVMSHESKLGEAQSSGTPSRAVQVGALLDLGTAGGKATMATISLALEDFYASQPGSTTTVALHVADCEDDEITATSAGTYRFHQISSPILTLALCRLIMHGLRIDVFASVVLVLLLSQTFFLCTERDPLRYGHAHKRVGLWAWHRKST